MVKFCSFLSPPTFFFFLEHGCIKSDSHLMTCLSMISGCRLSLNHARNYFVFF